MTYGLYPLEENIPIAALVDVYGMRIGVPSSNSRGFDRYTSAFKSGKGLRGCGSQGGGV